MSNDRSGDQHLFVGEGEMAQRMRSHHWSQTPLGAVETWSPSLRVMVQVLLASRFPCQILWGAAYVLLYNDAYRPILGSKHPQSLGQTGQVCWQEVWEFAAPLLEQVRTTGQAVGSDHQLLLIERSGYLEECYFSFSYTPIFDDLGQVGGIFNQVYETTDQVLQARRQQLQTQIATQVAIAKTPQAVYQLAAESFANAVDVPLALFYQFDSSADCAQLTSHVGLTGDRLELQTIDLTTRDSNGLANQALAAGLAAVFRTKQALMIEPLDLGQSAVEPSRASLRQMLLQPLVVPGQANALGCLVAGLNPHRALDLEYGRFFESVTEHLALVITKLMGLQQQQDARAESKALIAKRQQAEATLQRSEERYRTLFDSIDQGFCVIEMLFDANGRAIDYRFLEINPVFEQQSGLKQAVGKRMLELAPTHERYWFDIYGRVVITGEPVRFENRAEALNRWFEVYAYRIEPPESRQVAVLFNDISDRKRIEQEREQILQRETAAREAAETANRIKDEFLAVLSHELRTPLNAILGWATLLRQREFDAAKMNHALETIERNARLQTQLIEDLLDVSRILQEKLSLKTAPVPLASSIEAAIETVQLAAEAKAIQIETTLDHSIEPVLGDAARLQQVVWNLLTNAIKFTPTGGTVKISLERQELQAQIQVRDTGKGIALDFLPYVFDRFRQADSTTTRTFGGLGLGLAIVRHLVELHGGTVTASSSGEGQGATFTVQLPLMSLPPQTRQIQMSSAPSADLEGIEILVVDDDDDTREFTAFLLEQSGAIVTTAASARAALALLTEGSATFTESAPDVLVSDIGMPDVNGYMLIRQIRALPQGGEIRAIALTAYASELDYQQAIAAGFQAHLAKPIDPNQLLDVIHDLITSSS